METETSTEDIILSSISVTGLPRSGFATRDPAKEAERVASQVAKGRDLVNSEPTSFLVRVIRWRMADVGFGMAWYSNSMVLYGMLWFYLTANAASRK